MKKVILLLSFLFVLTLVQSTFAYSRLTVRDPRRWRNGQGTIEEAVFSIRPKGLYMECGMYLTFSARDLSFDNNDSLEVEFEFDLPHGSIVHDSWLWIEGDIIRGEIMDKWTAASIYENIVRRRRDPSILFKRGNNNYELRIFPMAAQALAGKDVAADLFTVDDRHHVVLSGAGGLRRGRPRGPCSRWRGSRSPRSRGGDATVSRRTLRDAPASPKRP